MVALYNSERFALCIIRRTDFVSRRYTYIYRITRQKKGKRTGRDCPKRYFNDFRNVVSENAEYWRLTKKTARIGLTKSYRNNILHDYGKKQGGMCRTELKNV